jgi:hypothetical protein
VVEIRYRQADKQYIVTNHGKVVLVTTNGAFAEELEQSLKEENPGPDKNLEVEEH